MTSVLIADDHLLFTDLVGAFLVDRGIVLSGVAASEAEALARTSANPPDVCLVDPAAVAEGPPVTFLSRLVRAAPETAVLVLTGRPHPGPAAAAAAGAAGYLLKSASGDELVAAIEGAARGEVGLGVGAAAETLGPHLPSVEGAATDNAADALRRLARLRARERECLELIVNGASTEEMAETMGVTVATVRSHVRAVLAALGVHSRLGAASFVLRYGLVGAVPRAS